MQFEMKHLYSELNVFCALVETNSFSKAALTLNVSQSTVSKKIKDLEEGLGYSLVVRSTRSFSITQKGQELYDFFITQKTLLNEFVLYQKPKDKQANGIVRLAIAETIAQYIVLPYVAEFLQNNPGITLEIYFTYYNVNLFEDKYDLVVTNYMPDQQTLKVRSLGKRQYGVFCTPQYIEKYGEVTSVNDLQNHLFTARISQDYKTFKEETLIDKDNNAIKFKASTSRLHISSGIAAITAGQSGHTIFVSSEEFIAKELKEGTFIRVLPDIVFGEMKYFLSTLPQNNNEAIKCVYDFIVKCFDKLNS